MQTDTATGISGAVSKRWFELLEQRKLKQLLEYATHSYDMVARCFAHCARCTRSTSGTLATVLIAMAAARCSLRITQLWCCAKPFFDVKSALAKLLSWASFNCWSIAPALILPMAHGLVPAAALRRRAVQRRAPSLSRPDISVPRLRPSDAEVQEFRDTGILAPLLQAAASGTHCTKACSLRSGTIDHCARQSWTSCCSICAVSYHSVGFTSAPLHDDDSADDGAPRPQTSIAPLLERGVGATLAALAACLHQVSVCWPPL